MYICVTHVDKQSRIPCNEAPMSVGPSFPSVAGLEIEFGNQTQWPTDYPLFFGTCDDDANINIAGVVRSLTPEEYAHEQWLENDTKAAQVRQHRNYLLSTTVDTLNPIRWELLSTEEQNAWRIYRQELLDVPDQDGFPWNVIWPSTPYK